MQKVRVPGFEPGAKPWQGLVLPGYTTPAFSGEFASQMLTTPAYCRIAFLGGTLICFLVFKILFSIFLQEEPWLKWLHIEP